MTHPQRDEALRLAREWMEDDATDDEGDLVAAALIAECEETERLAEYRDQVDEITSRQDVLDYWQTIGKSCSLGEAFSDLLAETERLRAALRERWLVEARRADSRDPEAYADERLATLNPTSPPDP